MGRWQYVNVRQMPSKNTQRVDVVARPQTGSPVSRTRRKVERKRRKFARPHWVIVTLVRDDVGVALE